MSKHKSTHRLINDNRHISYTTFREQLKSDLSRILPNISQFSTHSLRAGGQRQQLTPVLATVLFKDTVDGNRLLQRICTLKTTSQNSWKFPKLFRAINLQRKRHKFIDTNSHQSVFTISYSIERLVNQIK